MIFAQLKLIRLIISKENCNVIINNQLFMIFIVTFSELIRLYSEGGKRVKNSSLDNIYKLYMKDIYFYLLSLSKNKEIAEDIMQETFFRAYLYFENCPNDSIKPWLIRVAHNAYVDYVRKNSRSHTIDDKYFENLSDFRTPEDEILIKDQISKIKTIIDTMSQKQKMAILLSDFKGLSYKEGSSIMKVSLPYFKVLLFRARQIIREELERNDTIE